jgi:hypothetical protein
MSSEEKKLTPREWQAVTGITILDNDGWRTDNKPFTDEITHEEFTRRAFESTCAFPRSFFTDNTN